ncbi:MAG TPA: glycosyltransferase [Solirubrobacteraceae bacterium]
MRYHGRREFLVRLLTLPLRPTPLGRRLGYGYRFGRDETKARRWYRHDWRPVTVVVPTFGDPTLVSQAVRSVRRTTRRGRVAVVVVDDGSPPDVQQRLGRLADARVELMPENRGFAAAANRGIAVAAPDHDVVVLNSDVVAERGWLARLQYVAYGRPEIGIAGPRLLYPDRRVQSAGSFRNLAAPEWFDHRYRFRDAGDEQANIQLPVLGTTGACMYLKRALLDEVGGFDEGYGMAFEDMDLCLRAWSAGWEVAYAPRSALVHLESQTRPVEPGERELASQRRFWARWGDWFDARPVHTEDGRLRVIYVTEDTGVGGGHRDIFEHINRLRARGHDAQLWTLTAPPTWFDLEAPVRTFADYAALGAALEGEDAIKIATWWNTGHTVWRASVRRGIPVFFVQDVETSYYPDDATMQSQVLASYRQEFRYLTISSWNRARLRELGLEADLVAPGIDLGTFKPLAGVHRRDDVLLAIGRTNELKNLPLTVDAWRRLDGQAELRLFGIEPELGPLYGVPYVERPSDAEVNRLFNECTVFLQTSRHEGFALPPLEAMATGAAVVCTDAHGNRDFCVDGVNCLMPEPVPESVAGALSRLLGDPRLRRRLGAAGIETAAEYDWERRIDELEMFLERISGSLGASGAGAAAQRGSQAAQRLDQAPGG